VLHGIVFPEPVGLSVPSQGPPEATGNIARVAEHRTAMADLDVGIRTLDAAVRSEDLSIGSSSGGTWERNSLRSVGV